jgi:hypothetical protein
VDRLAGELALMAWRAIRDLGALDRPVDVVLGGGMIVPGGVLERHVRAGLAQLAPSAEVVAGVGQPVVGAVVAALGVAGASSAAAARYRAEFPRLGPAVSVRGAGGMP